MAKKFFTDESLNTLVSEIKGYADDAVSTKADSGHNHNGLYYSKAEVDTSFDELNEGFSNVIYQMYGEDLTEEGAPTIREIANDEATKATSGKADVGHSHSNYVPTSRKINNKALSSNINLIASDVGALPVDTVIPSKLSDLTADTTHRTVTDTEKATWNAKSNFSGSYNDLTNKPTIPSISGLATTAYVDDADNNEVDKVSGKGLSTNDYTTTEKNKLAGIAAGAEVNQNAFSNVVVGSTTIAADSETDSLTIAADDGISVSGDATKGEVTITNSGVRSITTGTSNGTIYVNTNGTSTNVAVKGLGSAAYTASTAYDAAGTAKAKADAALESAKTYTNGKIEVLMNNSSEAVDSIMELVAAMENNQTVVDALEEAVGKKAAASHTHTVSHTPGGTVSKPSFTGTQATISTVYTPAGTVSQPTFTGDTVSSGAPSDTAATVASSTHTHKYTPAGTVSKPTFTGSAVNSGSPSGTTSVNSVTALPSLDMEVASQCLVITFSEGSYSPVTLPSTSHVHSVTAAGSVSQPTFTGTEAPTTSITGTTNVASTSHTHSVAVSGSVSKPTFSGTEATISATYTPAGSVSQPTFTGTEATLTTSTPK